MKRLLLIILLPLFLWFCGANVISHTVSIAIDAIIGYYVLFLLCSRIMYSKGFEKLEEMLKEYKIEGITRVVLTSFQDFGDFCNIGRFYRKVVGYFNDSESNKKTCQKPHIKDDIINDIRVITLALIGVLESDEEICKGVSYKRLVEENFDDKWDYFYHSRYVAKIIREINKKCAINDLPALGILVVYSNEKIHEEYFGCDTWKVEDGITKDMIITDKKIQQFIKQMKANIEKYKKVLL